MRILAMYSSRFGHTTRIVGRIAESLRQQGHDVIVRPSHVVRDIGDDIDATIIAASVRYGFYAPHLKTFTRKHVNRLHSMPTAFLGVSLSSTKDGQDEPHTNRYSRKFLDGTPWKPTICRLFDGEINFDLYRGLDRILLNKILEVSGKPHGDGVKVEYTDWEAVDGFARDFAALLR
ncbi:MAG: flavodoxin domain-containing protein [Actinomycetaceae bacterium]|nr:flavodoxin domain-containing protein [Actinomycetaceae bacterium]